VIRGTKFIWLAGVLLAALTARAASPAAPAGWRLVWSDEFETPGAPDPARWGYASGGDGWGNHELQYYTADRRENARVEGGRLIIEARQEKWQGNPYTSARLITKGKGDWTYGRLEVRARLPVGRGSWPAIWLLPTVWDLGDHLWPDNGEIDVMEHVGHEPGVIHASTHSRLHQWKQGTQRTATLTVPDATSAFHTYAMEWEPGEIRIYVDDQHYFTSRRDGGDWKSWPFYRPFHLVLNVAVGGDWGSVQGIDPTSFPQRMEIDYVRFYQRPTP